MRTTITKRFAFILMAVMIVFSPQFVGEANASNDWTKDMIGELDRAPDASATARLNGSRAFRGEGQGTFDKGQQEANVSGGLSGMFRVLSTALVLLGLGYALLMLVKKIKSTKDPVEESNALKLVESLWLGKGQRVMLVNVGGQQVLLGASGGSLQSLAVLDGEAKEGNQPAKNAANDDYFPSMLKSEMAEEATPREPTYNRTGRLETREEELQSSPKVSNERVKQILKRLNHL